MRTWKSSFFEGYKGMREYLERDFRKKAGNDPGLSVQFSAAYSVRQPRTLGLYDLAIRVCRAHDQGVKNSRVKGVLWYFLFLEVTARRGWQGMQVPGCDVFELSAAILHTHSWLLHRCQLM
jgi:hypothetical protein